ncbi:MAG TPA: AAA family ATPase, partial [Ktedonobacteraceae bacterium]|nr:AAA family ATPase [Ktedonobacteraceae bacterium]
MEAPFLSPIICPVVIGRVREVTRLHMLVDRAKSGEGQVALISGEAGIGKSRLVAEVKTEALSNGFLLLQGSCFPTDHAIPYAPLLDLLRSHFSDHSQSTPAHSVERIAQAFLPLLPDLSHALAGGPPPSTLTLLDPEQEKRRRFETLAQFLTDLTRWRPVLCVLEDLHWSDNTSLEFLHYLARRCAAHRLLLVLTYRSDEVHSSLRHFLAQLDRERLVQEFALARLTQSEVSAMLSAIFALHRSIFAMPSLVQGDLLDAMYALTEGNPFFIEELLKSLIEAGDIVYEQGRWQRKEPGEWHIPRSIHDIVELRTAHLSEGARQVLHLAAVTGRHFDFVLLQALTHQDEVQLLRLLKELIAAQLVAEESAERFA